MAGSTIFVRKIIRLLHCASIFAQTVMWSDSYDLHVFFYQISGVECIHFIILHTTKQLEGDNISRILVFEFRLEDVVYGGVR